MNYIRGTVFNCSRIIDPVWLKMDNFAFLVNDIESAAGINANSSHV